jgi:hypothetical protein
MLHNRFFNLRTFFSSIYILNISYLLFFFVIGFRTREREHQREVLKEIISYITYKDNTCIFGLISKMK